MIRQRTISCSPAEHSMCSEHVLVHYTPRHSCYNIFICTIFSSLREERKCEKSSLNAPRAKILVSKTFSSHGLAHTAEGKEWAEIIALAGHNLCLVNSSKSADTSYSNKFSETDLDTMTLLTHSQSTVMHRWQKRSL